MEAEHTPHVAKLSWVVMRGGGGSGMGGGWHHNSVLWAIRVEWVQGWSRMHLGGSSNGEETRITARSGAHDTVIA